MRQVLDREKSLTKLLDMGKLDQTRLSRVYFLFLDDTYRGGGDNIQHGFFEVASSSVDSSRAHPFFSYC